ncbi:tetratricopeptide repeat protein [Sphingosinicella sp.]|uniref:tetratricopeptide repeat protein n=1 Tax=Sphingosinicella sp. TaxID=1917971 RepID=UPI0040376101
MEQANALIEQARTARQSGDRDRAIELQRQAVGLLRQLEDAPRLAHALRHLGDLLVEAGEPEAAAVPLAEALDIYRDAPAADPLDIANAARAAAVQSEAIGDSRRAQHLWREARDRYVALDDRLRELTGENAGQAEAEARLRVLG